MHLYSDLRKKVDAIVARGGGVPDRDAPLVLEETKFWVTVEESREDTEGVELMSCIMKHFIHVCSSYVLTYIYIYMYIHM